MLEKENPKVINAWAMYDWANSVYPLVITSSIFPIYYEQITSSPESDIISFFGMEFVNTALYAYILSFSFLLVACISPLLSAISDYSGNKKRFMQFFCYLGGIACCSLFFFDKDNLWIGIIGFMLATIGFSGSLVFYNAYLPEISTPENHDRVSARGFAFGYIGSSLLLIFNLVMIMNPSWFGIEEGTFPARFSFLLVGLWWIGFAQIPFFVLPNNPYEKKAEGNYFSKGYSELLVVWNELKKFRYLRVFLFSFLLYNMGVQTVMNVATLFGTKELKLESSQLITTILIIQFVAIGGAYLFSFLSGKFGNKAGLSLALLIWIGICICAYFVMDAHGFYALAFVVGLVMGGVQSLSRSTYSKLLPETTTDHASYFSFYDVCDKLGYVVGIASFGIMEELTGSMRNSVILLALFFMAGMVLLVKVGKPASLGPKLKKL